MTRPPRTAAARPARARAGAAAGGALRRLAPVLAAALLVAPAGCVSLGRTSTGAIPRPEAIAGLRAGEPIAAVVTSCGAPLEAWRHPDGMVLVWRARRYDYDRVGLDPSRALSFLQIGDLATGVLSNLKLVVEWGEAFEDRLVAIFDREDRLLAWAFRAGEDDAPIGRDP